MIMAYVNSMSHLGKTLFQLEFKTCLIFNFIVLLTAKVLQAGTILKLSFDLSDYTQIEYDRLSAHSKVQFWLESSSLVGNSKFIPKDTTIFKGFQLKLTFRHSSFRLFSVSVLKFRVKRLSVFVFLVKQHITHFT